MTIMTAWVLRTALLKAYNILYIQSVRRAWPFLLFLSFFVWNLGVREQPQSYRKLYIPSYERLLAPFLVFPTPLTLTSIYDSANDRAELLGLAHIPSVKFNFTNLAQWHWHQLYGGLYKRTPHTPWHAAKGVMGCREWNPAWNAE